VIAHYPYYVVLDDGRDGKSYMILKALDESHNDHMGLVSSELVVRVSSRQRASMFVRPM